MRAFTYHRAASIADALHARAAAAPHTAFLAGGTTLLDLVKLDVMRPDHVIDVNRLPLAGIDALPDGSLRVGALVRNSALAWHAAVRRDFPLVAQAILAGASGQIRNMATTAGNVLQRTRCPYFRDNVSACNKREPGSGCAAREGYNRMHAVLGGSEACIATHPSDLCVALAAIDAQLELVGPRGQRVVPLRAFHLLPGDTPEREHDLAPDELITAVVLPAAARGGRQQYLKLRDRESYEFALASAAVAVRLEGETITAASIALGGVGTKPWHAPEAEAALRGARATVDAFRAAADAALREARPRTCNAFKIPLARQALIRALENAIA